MLCSIGGDWGESNEEARAAADASDFREDGFCGEKCSDRNVGDEGMSGGDRVTMDMSVP